MYALAVLSGPEQLPMVLRSGKSVRNVWKLFSDTLQARIIRLHENPIRIVRLKIACFICVKWYFP